MLTMSCKDNNGTLLTKKLSVMFSIFFKISITVGERKEGRWLMFILVISEFIKVLFFNN